MTAVCQVQYVHVLMLKSLKQTGSEQCISVSQTVEELSVAVSRVIQETTAENSDAWS